MNKEIPVIVTAGSSYVDIDAYACSIALAELLQLRGINAIAFSTAQCNHSVSKSLKRDTQILSVLPTAYQNQKARYIIVDVSDPEYLEDSVPLAQITEIYDHHAGFEEYWKKNIGEKAHIEFIGAAATMIFREWKNFNLQDKMKHSTMQLLVAAILDNTLNLKSRNTTEADIEAFKELCKLGDIDESWCATYFSEVQSTIESDLRSALFNDLKIVRDNNILPSHIFQLCLWDSMYVSDRLEEVQSWFAGLQNNWMINIIDIKHQCSYFICYDLKYQKSIELIFGVCFKDGVAHSEKFYLRKEIIKKAFYNN